MKKIMMAKYGFVRWPEQDFSDDGNRFQCYRIGNRIRVTKLVADGEAYIHASIDGNKLTYNVYSKLPHYPALDKLNGVSIASLTDDDLFDLVEACVLYEKEYTKAENSIVMPTIDEIRQQCLKVQAKANQELNEINQHFNIALASKATEWEWREMRKYLLNIAARVDTFNPDKYPQTIFNTARSINFCSPDCTELQDSYYFTWIMEKINR